MTGFERGLTDRTALVTGGAQGIGLAVVQRLLAEGVRVIVLDKSAEHCRSLSAGLGTGDSLTVVEGDVTEQADVTAAFDRRPPDWKPVTLLVNCAAGFVFRNLQVASLEDWAAVFEPTIGGMSLMTRAFAERIPPEMSGSVVNMASISAHIAQEGYLTYNTSKAAVLGFTRCVAQELAPRGIRVNSVSPGTVWNANNERYHREQLGLDRATAERDPSHGGKFLLGRFADPEEVAAPIVFLLSAEASYITGTDLVVDGGYLAQ